MAVVALYAVQRMNSILIMTCHIQKGVQVLLQKMLGFYAQGTIYQNQIKSNNFIFELTCNNFFSKLVRPI